MCACVVIAAERSTRKHTLGTVGQYTNVFVCLLLCKREREREREGPQECCERGFWHEQSSSNKQLGTISPPKRRFGCRQRHLNTIF